MVKKALAKKVVCLAGFGILVLCALGSVWWLTHGDEKVYGGGLINTAELSDEFMKKYFDTYAEMTTNGEQENMLIVISYGEPDGHGAKEIAEGPNHTYYLMYDTPKMKELAHEALIKDNVVSVEKNEKMDREIDTAKKNPESTNDFGKEYYDWISELSQRYRQSQIKAAVRVNSEMLRFYWSVGKDIEERKLDNKYGSHFYENLSRDLSLALNKKSGLSPTSLKYTKYFYCLYSPHHEIRQQLVDDLETPNRPQLVDDLEILFRIPWGITVISSIR